MLKLTVFLLLLCHVNAQRNESRGPTGNKAQIGPIDGPNPGDRPPVTTRPGDNIGGPPPGDKITVAPRPGDNIGPTTPKKGTISTTKSETEFADGTKKITEEQVITPGREGSFSSETRESHIGPLDGVSLPGNHQSETVLYTSNSHGLHMYRTDPDGKLREVKPEEMNGPDGSGISIRTFGDSGSPNSHMIFTSTGNSGFSHPGGFTYAGPGIAASGSSSGICQDLSPLCFMSNPASCRYGVSGQWTAYASQCPLSCGMCVSPGRHGYDEKHTEAEIELDRAKPLGSLADEENNSSDCVDDYPECRLVSDVCFSAPYLNFARYKCARTCGYCGHCADKNPEECAKFKGHCQSPLVQTNLQYNCAKTCGFCERQRQHLAQDCDDRRADCKILQSRCTMPGYLTFATTECPFTCRMCGMHTTVYHGAVGAAGGYPSTMAMASAGGIGVGTGVGIGLGGFGFPFSYGR